MFSRPDDTFPGDRFWNLMTLSQGAGLWDLMACSPGGGFLRPDDTLPGGGFLRPEDTFPGWELWDLLTRSQGVVFLRPDNTLVFGTWWYPPRRVGFLGPEDMLPGGQVFDILGSTQKKTFSGSLSSASSGVRVLRTVLFIFKDSGLFIKNQKCKARDYFKIRTHGSHVFPFSISTNVRSLFPRQPL